MDIDSDPVPAWPLRSEKHTLAPSRNKSLAIPFRSPLTTDFRGCFDFGSPNTCKSEHTLLTFSCNAAGKDLDEPIHGLARRTSATCAFSPNGVLWVRRYCQELLKTSQRSLPTTEGVLCELLECLWWVKGKRLGTVEGKEA